MNDASRIRANITGTIFGVLFGIGTAIPGVIGNIPGCGCILGWFVWFSALFLGGFAGLFAAIFADWAKIPYERGLGAGGLLGLRAGALAGLIGGLVFAVMSTVLVMLAPTVGGPTGSDAQRVQDSATGAVMVTMLTAFLNIGLVPLCAGLCGGFWGFVVGAIRRREDATAAAPSKAGLRPGYLAFALAASWAIMVLMALGSFITFSNSEHGGGTPSPVAAAVPPAQGAERPAAAEPAAAAPTAAEGFPAAELAASDEVALDAPCPNVSATASRFLTEGHTDHVAGRAFDDDATTAWGVHDAVGGSDWLEATLTPAMRVSRVVVTTGYDRHNRHGDLFTGNAHLRRFTLLTDAGRRTVEVAADQRQVEVRLNAETSRIRLVVDDVWPGERWQDLELSEVQVYCSR